MRKIWYPGTLYNYFESPLKKILFYLKRAQNFKITQVCYLKMSPSTVSFEPKCFEQNKRF